MVCKTYGCRGIKIAFNCSVNRNIANIHYRLANYNS